MRKPISIAMMISVGLHAALLLLVAWTPDHPLPDAALHNELIVSLNGDDSSGLEATSRPSDAASPGPSLAAAEQVPSSVVAAPEAAVDTVRESEILADEGVPEVESSESSMPAAVMEAPAGDAEASLAPLEQKPKAAATITTTVATSVTAEPLSPRQRRMMDKKIRRWTETYYKHQNSEEEMTWRHKGQEYTARFANLPADHDMALDRVVVEVSTEVDGERLSTELQMKRLAFSSYAQFVNRWDESVQIHDDELDGRFHSNSAINLAYSRDAKPQFHGKVTTSARNVNITENRARARRDQVFLGGLQTGVRSIRLPKNFVPLPDSADFREDQIHEFDEDTRITFHADGSYTWISFADGLFERRANIRSPASYLIAKGKAKLHIQGTVSGKVLVYSPERLVIVGDLVYARDPERNDNVDDFIGLVSAKSIRVAGPKITGPRRPENHGGDLCEAPVFDRRHTQ